MPVASSPGDFDAILKFLHNLPGGFSPLVNVVTKLRCGRAGLVDCPLYFDGPEDVQTVLWFNVYAIQYCGTHRICVETTDAESLRRLCDESGLSGCDAFRLAAVRPESEEMVRSLFPAWRQRHECVEAEVLYLPREAEIGSLSCPEGYTFRAAIDDDVAFFHDNWKFSSGSEVPTDVAEKYGVIFGLMPSVVVLHGDGVVGAGLQDIGGSVDKVLVAKEHRGKGVGSFIVRRLSQLIRDEDNDSVPFTYVEPSNDGGKKLFEKLGFRKWEDLTLIWATVGKGEMGCSC